MREKGIWKINKWTSTWTANEQPREQPMRSHAAHLGCGFLSGSSSRVRVFPRQLIEGSGFFIRPYKGKKTKKFNLKIFSLHQEIIWKWMKDLIMETPLHGKKATNPWWKDGCKKRKPRRGCEGWGGSINREIIQLKHKPRLDDPKRVAFLRQTFRPSPSRLRQGACPLDRPGLL